MLENVSEEYSFTSVGTDANVQRILFLRVKFWSNETTRFSIKKFFNSLGMDNAILFFRLFSIFTKSEVDVGSQWLFKHNSNAIFSAASKQSSVKSFYDFYFRSLVMTA